MVTKNPQKSHKYICEECNTKTDNKKDFLKHNSTAKHLKNMAGDKKGEKGDKKIPIFICDTCTKNYESRNGLWKHKKKCFNLITLSTINTRNNPVIEVYSSTTTTNEVSHTEVSHTEVSHAEVSHAEVSYLTTLVLEVVKNNNELQKQTNEIHKQHYELQKQNQEFQKQMLEVYKTNTTTNIHQNSHNKTFNLQFFLNEQCKDAMNIMDFVNSMTLEFADLEDVGKCGYVEGISKIIIKKLNELDIYKRPIHCSDAKREIMYVKDDNIWEKENSTYDKLRKAIKYVTKKNSDMLITWSKKYPSCMNTSHPLNDTYIQLMGQAMGGKEDFVDSENKIMKKIAKSVLIDKTF